MPSQDDLLEIVTAQGITDERLLEAFRKIPRAGFVPAEYADAAYRDRPVPIPHDQTTSQPSLSARMIEALDVTPTDRALEVGTGFGFQTALLARLAAHVTSIERWPDLARNEPARTSTRHGDRQRRRAHRRRQPRGGGRRAVRRDPLVGGVPGGARGRSSNQLAVGGRLVQPVGPGRRRGGHPVREGRDRVCTGSPSWWPPASFA
jgi:protein-L-isoaspartate(D-aspartate) O-methyltransferase